MDVLTEKAENSGLLTILQWPDPVLFKKSEPVNSVTGDIRSLADRMAQTMLAAPGLGLAAPQVGVSKRLIVVVSPEDGAKPFAMVNPEILETGEAVMDEEGCLSMPEIYAYVERPEWIIARYTDINGDTQTVRAEDIMARCIAHEIDHLNGVLFWDHLGFMKRDWLKRKFKKMSR
ncbi:MAG: peptide deformylase [Nitrospinae bacterium]|nr:peptide deformylase [Nitrospinota bacterium]